MRSTLFSPVLLSSLGFGGIAWVASWTSDGGLNVCLFNISLIRGLFGCFFVAGFARRLDPCFVNKCGNRKWQAIISSTTCSLFMRVTANLSAFILITSFLSSLRVNVLRLLPVRNIPKFKDRANWSRNTFQPMRRHACVYQHTNQNIAPVIKNFHNSGRSRTELKMSLRYSFRFHI